VAGESFLKLLLGRGKLTGYPRPFCNGQPGIDLSFMNTLAVSIAFQQGAEKMWFPKVSFKALRRKKNGRDDWI
jgi:hypothetical protein